MLTRDTLRGTWGTVLLPIEADESIHWKKLEEEIDFLAASGVAGLYTNGSAGEFFSQTNDEFFRLNLMVAKACRSAGIPFQIGACHPFAKDSLERITLSKALFPDAFQVILPDWFPVKPKEAIAFLERAAAAAAPIPLVLYMPPHAKTKFTLADIAMLAKAVPSLIGIKVAGGDAAWYGEIAANQLDLAVFVPGHRLATGLSLGAHGSYSNVACIHPRGAVLWYELMQRDPVRAQEIEREILAFLQKRILPLCAKYVDAGIDKLLAHAGGWGAVGTRLRWPYDGPTVEEADEVRSFTREELPLFFALVENGETASV